MPTLDKVEVARAFMESEEPRRAAQTSCGRLRASSPPAPRLALPPLHEAAPETTPSVVEAAVHGWSGPLSAVALRLSLGGRRGFLLPSRRHPADPGIQPLGESADGSALPRGVPPLEENDDLLPGIDHPVL